MPGHCELNQTPHTLQYKMFYQGKVLARKWRLINTNPLLHFSKPGNTGPARAPPLPPKAVCIPQGPSGAGMARADMSSGGHQKCQRCLCCAPVCPRRHTASNTDPGWQNNCSIKWKSIIRNSTEIYRENFSLTNLLRAGKKCWQWQRRWTSENKDVPELFPAGAALPEPITRGDSAVREALAEAEQPHPAAAGSLRGQGHQGHQGHLRDKDTAGEAALLCTARGQRWPRNKLLTGSQGGLHPQLLLSSRLENWIVNSKLSYSPKALNVWCTFAICIQLWFNALVVLHKSFPSSDKTIPGCWSKWWWWDAAPQLQ